jgi:hypothetical protein
MGDIFRGMIGDFNGFALENSDFDPMSDDSDIDSFFDGGQGEDVIVNKKAIKKSRKIFKKTKKSGAFGGFGF